MGILIAVTSTHLHAASFFSVSVRIYIYHHTRDETRHKQKAWEEKKTSRTLSTIGELKYAPISTLYLFFSFSPPFPLSLHVLSSRPRVTHNPAYGRRKQTNKQKNTSRNLFPFLLPFTQNTHFLSLSRSPHRASSLSLSLSLSFVYTLTSFLRSYSLSLSQPLVSLACFAPPPLRVPPCSLCCWILNNSFMTQNPATL